MSYRLAVLLVTAALTACTGRLPVAEKPASLQAGSRWQVEWLGERPLVDNSHLSLTLAEEGRAYGDGGCNRWLSSYELHGEQLTFTAPSSTLMACPGALMEQEQRFLHMLSKITRWDFSTTGQLQLWADQGDPIRLWPLKEED
ncbi:hypothetical protein AXE65_05725 [Ventosimonas gracilis]|uniref:DUF306 domain-containing protein n=1 Tax=Ventosimonas gracilis TaxID=1680762 RepID=A0A139SNL7_9GAMM|nr:META domain-containing protein [Ventosimonas gracilis]KXU36148.1 hypothetical protein AXE65_05725 [Ventosimonas gracilis]